MELIKYDAACKAIAECRAVDEVKDLRDKAIALEAYARIATNKNLEIDAAEIRLRAERRIGEMMAEQKAAGGMSPGGKPTQKSYRGIENPSINAAPPTLKDAGIDKNLAKRARKLAAVAEKDFEQAMDDHRERQEAATAATFDQLEAAADGADYADGALWSAWLLADADERLEFMNRAGLQYAPELEAGAVDGQVWAEFVAHRAAIRKPLRRQSAVKNYAVLAGLTAAQQRECVDRTIASGWTGLFPPKGASTDERKSPLERVADEYRKETG